MTTCTVCHEAELVEKRETYLYKECGLDNVVLLDQPVRRCPNCGAHELSLRALSRLHREIAISIINRPSKLTGQEVRFLRKHLGYSGIDFAQVIGVARSHLSRWENDAEPIGPANDRLLRLLVAQGDKVDDYAAEDLKKLTDEKAVPKPIKFRQIAKSWTLEATP